MRSYTNKEGEVVTVSQEHLDTATKIKRELQMASPSYRCNWTEHERLMKKEGFEDSEVSENYRQMIKKYQTDNGTIDTRAKQADLVADSKLTSIKEAVGEMYYTKREVQMESLKLGKLKRELTKTAVVAEEVKNAFLNTEWSFPEHISSPKLISETNKMVLTVSDWHFGAVVEDSKGNNYNFEVAKKRIAKLIRETEKYGALFGVTDIVVANIGDMIEGLYMRSYNQPFETEFNVADQISKVTKELIGLLIALSKTFNVSYFGVAGNHDRWFFDKNTVDGDNGMKVINEGVKTFIELSEAERIEYIEVDHNFNYEKLIEIGGKKFKFIHGDFEGKTMNIDKHIAMDQEDIDVLVMGHYHCYQVIEGNYGKLSIINGSIMGRNNFSRKFKASANASQTLIIVTEDKVVPIKVDLQSY